MIQAGIIQVSKHAMDLINAGKAYYGSGGVRLLDGRFVELYRIGRNLLQHGPNTLPINPIIPSPDPVTMTVQIANQVVGTAASLVNVYYSYKNGQKLNRIISMISTLQGIAWVNTAIGAANMALTAISFSIINSKLDGLSQQITTAVSDLKREMKVIQLEDKTVEILTLIANLKSTTHYLSVQPLNRQDEIQIEKLLNSAKQLIIWLENQFEVAGPMESGTLFTLLYDLSLMYTSVLKEYCAQYYYLENCFPGNFPDWTEVYMYVDSNKVQSGLKRTIWLANPTETTENLEGTFDFTLNTIHLQYQELQETKEVIPQLSREAYFDFDTFVKQKLHSGDVEVIDQALEEDSRESVLFRKNGFVMA